MLRLCLLVVVVGKEEEVAVPEELEAELTPEVLARIEGQLIKAVMANGQLKVSM